ncbi:RNA polymerase sigma-54 factor [Rhodovulum iodosum]|uniref:RNA polymerase sigma-54 factor n=1 Tax=Rhodovulum iodosum TaxID=68291 RepID=A0ABV3XS83_9RHOB|nr:RNA polymerase factor sigma-54 [Rhodovulum robiginosum]RSK30510.1 RNA polymerase sigma-54 factor [Rhodovulum robiginosum]
MGRPLNLAPKLALKQKTNLAMTAQLRQAIAVLQLSNLELLAFLEEAARDNPFIDIVGPERAVAPGAGPAPPTGDGLPDNAPSLVHHVTRQIELAIADPAARRVALAFVDALEPHGWLGEDVQSIAARCGCPVAEAEAVLEVLQGFEPAGLFARSLADCLRLQARDRGVLSSALDCLLDNLTLLSDGGPGALARRCGCDEKEVRRNLALLRRFDPKPGHAFAVDPLILRPPDVVVRRDGPGWSVTLNRATLPQLRLRDGLGAAAPALAAALAEARSLKRAIDQRNASTLAVTAEIVQRQAAYLDGVRPCPGPLSLQEVANALGLHPSTAGRAAAGLTVETPQGVMDLRALLSRAIPATAAGGAVSAREVMHRIQTMIAGEPAERPLSDAKIAAGLQAQGVAIERRTVTKYRLRLNIPGSAARRRTALADGR